MQSLNFNTYHSKQQHEIMVKAVAWGWALAPISRLL
jgi:hypothetical protein